jgi:transposase
MNAGKLLFAQLMDFVPWTSFARSVARYGGDHRVRSLTCTEQYRAMAFAQLTFRESLRDIEACLNTQPNKLYAMGFRAPVRRSTLADANERRDWRIYAELTQRLMVQARKLYANDSFGVDLDGAAYALDSTTIDLCLSLFPWAHFRSTKSAVKVHALLDLHGSIPAFIRVTTGDRHDVNILDEIVIEPGAYYIMDRGYMDFFRLHRIHLAGAFFVTRARSDQRLRRVYSRPAHKPSGIIADQIVSLEVFRTHRDYPSHLRRIRFHDPQTGKHLIFLTNQLTLPATTICALYKSRWRVELFFKWIKQHLRIKAFYGNTENAVKTQIWIAISVYLLVAIIKKRMQMAGSLYTFLQVLSVTLFEKMPISQALQPAHYTTATTPDPNQLSLFDF